MAKDPKKAIAIVERNYKCQWRHWPFLLVEESVATPLLEECEDDIHTPEMGTWESSGTSKTSKFDCRGENTLPWGVLHVVRKLLKCQCWKCLRMSRLDICSTSYGKKKGRESTWNSFGTPPWESQDKKPFECGCCGATHRILYGGRWWLPPSPGHGESSESVLPVACLRVATPLWNKCEDETRIPKSGNLESSGTPKTLELHFRGQNTLSWSVLYTVEKVLKCRCRKWPCMSHSDICSTSYGQKKGRESNWQFDSQPLKVGNRPDPSVCRWSATHRWKALEESYKFSLELIPIKSPSWELWAPKVPRVQTGTISRLLLGSPRTKSHPDVGATEQRREY
jgi:hypothetical protein